jgi:hypothetical protein
MCVVYWSEIHQLKYQRGFIFNGFRSNSQRWKYAILTNIFYRIRICSFFIHLAWRRYHSTAKAWSFRMWKNLVHTQSNSDTIARWSSITFFFIHPVVISRLIFIARHLSTSIVLSRFPTEFRRFPNHTFSSWWTRSKNEMFFGGFCIDQSWLDLKVICFV